MAMNAEEQRMAAAVNGAMRRPGRRYTAYGEADRQALQAEANRLNRRADLLLASVEQEDNGADPNAE